MAICKRCGRDNQDLYKFCLGCGGELGGGDPADAAQLGSDAGTTLRDKKPPAGAADDDPPPDADGSIDIDLELRDRRDSLAHIPPMPGLAVAEEAASASRAAAGRACPRCGHLVPNDFAFCGQCGSPVDGAPAATPARSVAPVIGAGAVQGRLILIRPDGTEGGVHPLHEGENPIGRGLGPLFDADGYLSPRHAEIVLNAAGVVVRDTGSLNGVFVRLTDEEELTDGDIFRIGQELLRFDEIAAPVPLEDGTDIMGSPNPGYWGRLALIVGRDQDGSAFPLFGDAVLLGRERGDILFPEDGYVSGQHARVSIRDGRFYLADLNSSNGTFMRIRGERAVKAGSAILMGQQLFRISF